jgi:acetyl esterase
MPLDPDAQAVVDLTEELRPGPYYEIGVDEARRFSAAQEPAAGQAVHQVTDRLLPGPHGEIPIRIYQPSDRAGLPIFVWIHGGGFVLGDLQSGDVISRLLCNRAGCVVVSVDYRLAPEHKFPIAFDESLAALRWVAAHPDALRGDSDRIAIGGDSAGGNLAAAVALAARDGGGPPILLQVLVYPATEYAVERPSWRRNGEGPMLSSKDVVWFWDQYLRDEGDYADPRAMPSRAPTHGGLPPAFVLTAEYDLLCDDGQAYGRQLAEAGVEVTSRQYDGVFHGFFGMPGVVAKADEALEDVASALRARFGTAPIER